MSNLPTINGTPPQAQPKKKTSADRQPAEVPASEGYIPRNVDVRMTRPQAKILRDKLRKLQDEGAKTADGRHVTNRSQAVRWILENEVQ